MSDFVEVGDRVWVARYEWADANVTAIGGERGLAVVDTHGSTAAGRRVLEDLRRLGAGAVCAVVNTHWHWDHVFGNAAFREQDQQVPVHAQERAARSLADHGEQCKSQWASEEAHAAEVAETQIVVPDRLFTHTDSLDMGDRAVELIHPGRGHTDGDLVVRIDQAGVLLTGDLVEESAHPWIGDDSWPMDWPGTLAALAELIDGSDVVVPGHGAPVDRGFVQRQRAELAQIRTNITTLAAAGVPRSDAARHGDWPWDPADIRIGNAITRGYAELGMS